MLRYRAPHAIVGCLLVLFLAGLMAARALAVRPVEPAAGARHHTWPTTTTVSTTTASTTTASTTTTSTTTTTTTTGGTPHLALGVSTAGVNSSSSDPGTALDRFASEVGQLPAIAMWYQTWYPGYAHKLVNPTVMNALLSRGVIPMITWMPYTTVDNSQWATYTDIAAGRYDSYLQAAATEAAAWGHPFLVRPFHEMNGRWEPWGIGVNGNTASAFVAAWRHMVSVFRAAGATNVRFVFSPNTISTASPDFTPEYPGDNYVDWVALDGYNWGTSTSGQTWRSFTTIFSQSYTTLTSISARPVMVAETASTEVGGSKATWITSTYLTQIPQSFPALRAVVWFNHQKETSWPVDSSSTALAAFRTVVAAPDDQLSASGLP
jgi:beta-mannanase